MIDNRALLVLAADTVDKYEAEIGQYAVASDRLINLIEDALKEAFKRGFNDCSEGKKLMESEESK